MPDAVATKPKLSIAHQLHPRIHRDFLYVYPVISRRSHGLSVGINLNPDKACNFHCVYCQVDRVTPPKVAMLALSTLERELRQMIALVESGALAAEYPFNTAMDLATRINDIALSGDGEPTTARQFLQVVETVVKVKQEARLNDTKIVLITDCAGLDRRDVQTGLKLLDENNGEVWAKLDAGTEPYYRQVNRTSVFFSRILKNLALAASQRPIVIQSLFMRFHGEPPPTGEIEAYGDRLNDIIRGGGKIKLVQLYTVARKPLEDWVEPLNDDELDIIGELIQRRTSLPVGKFYGAK